MSHGMGWIATTAEECRDMMLLATDLSLGLIYGDRIEGCFLITALHKHILAYRQLTSSEHVAS